MNAVLASPRREHYTGYLTVVLNTIRINPLTDELSVRVLVRGADCKWTGLILKRVYDAVAGKVAVIFGAGPSLEWSLRYLKPLIKGSRENLCLLAADGATTALINEGLVPDIVTTDLDGDLNSLIEANLRGSVIMLHVHGDNLQEVLRSYYRFPGAVLLTTQVHPRSCILGIGGFTDGDRAVLVALRNQAEAVVLIGMDFGETVGKYSKPWLRGNVRVWPSKRRKFMVAKHFIEDAVLMSRVKTFIFPKNIGGLKHVEEVGYEGLTRVIKGQGSL